MSNNVSIKYAEPDVTVSTVSENKVLVIGKSSTFTGIIKNVSSISQLEDEGMSASTDQVYHTVADILNNTSDVTVTLACTTTNQSGSTVQDVSLDGTKDGSNLEFTVPYAPLTSVSNYEVMINATGNLPDLTDADGATTKYSYTGYWLDVITGIDAQQVNNTYNGEIEITADTYLTVSGATGQFSGYIPGPGDFIRADVSKNNLSDMISELTKPEYRFQYFCFSYPPVSEDSSKEYTDDFRHGTGYCITDSWYDDVNFGRALAGRFESHERGTEFVFSLPDSVSPSDKIDAKFVSGESSVTGYTWHEYIGSITNDPYSIATVAYQDSLLEDAFSSVSQVGQPTDPAVLLINRRMSDDPPRPTTYLGVPLGNVAQLENPAPNIINAWNEINVNCIGVTEGNFTTQVFLGNHTLNNSYPNSTINYMQCKHLIRYAIKQSLWQALYNRNLHFDLDSMIEIKDIIRAKCEEYQELGIIDSGDITITIPDIERLQKEDSLSEGEAAILAAHRASGKVDNIKVEIPWSGDVESIYVTGLVNS